MAFVKVQKAAEICWHNFLANWNWYMSFCKFIKQMLKCDWAQRKCKDCVVIQNQASNYEKSEKSTSQWTMLLHFLMVCPKGWTVPDLQTLQFLLLQSSQGRMGWESIWWDCAGRANHENTSSKFVSVNLWVTLAQILKCIKKTFSEDVTNLNRQFWIKFPFFSVRHSYIYKIYTFTEKINPINDRRGCTTCTVENHVGCWYDVTLLLRNRISWITIYSHGKSGWFFHQMHHWILTYHFHPKLYPNSSYKYLPLWPKGYGVRERYPTPLSPMWHVVISVFVSWLSLLACDASLFWFLEGFWEGSPCSARFKRQHSMRRFLQPRMGRL